MDIITSTLREIVGPTDHQIELSDLDNSTTAEGETNICKIFKVPEQNIHQDNEHAFKPKILSIGPYNYGSSHLRGMESMKLTCQVGILGSDSENYYDRDEIQELQKEARNFYFENIAMEPKSFARMLLLDGCFILAALTGMRHGPVEDMENLMQQEGLNRHDILHDLLLVENQIPFFVLGEIHAIDAVEGETTESLKEKIATRVERVLQQYPKAIGISEICKKDFLHLVHLCHMFFQPSPNSVEHHHDQAVINQWHRAMEYHEAGVKFRVKPSSTRCSLLDVTFSKGTMEIPHLSIDANTESIFSNLIMFERRYPHAGNYINTYITFMSKLLSYKEDVKLLVRERIIEIVGHQKEILNLFSRLNRLVVCPDNGKDYYLKSTVQSVEAHYRWRPNWWMAWLKQNRLTNPFVVLATLGGIIVLICTVFQAVFAGLQFFMRK